MVRALVALGGVGCISSGGAIVGNSVEDGDRIDSVAGVPLQLELARDVDARRAEAVWLTLGAEVEAVSSISGGFLELHRHVPARVELLGRESIAVVPFERPLPDRVQEIRILGLERRGRPVEESIRYRTLPNPAVEELRAGLEHQVQCQVDRQNRRRRCREGPGLYDPEKDEMVFSGRPDVRAFRYEEGRPVDVRFYEDGDESQLEWVTTASWGERETVTELRHVRTGMDRRLGTEDDLVLAVQQALVDEEGFLTHWWQVSPGPDGDLRTDDDNLARARRFEYRPDGLLRRSIGLGELGPDGRPITAISARTYEYDRLRRVTRFVDTSVGPDGELFTADDFVSEYETTWVLDATGRVIAELTGTSAIVHERDERGRLVATYTNHSPGPDGEWLTDDDRGAVYGEQQATVYTWTDDGQLLRRDRITSGEDRELFTEDDRIVRRVDYSP